MATSRSPLSIQLSREWSFNDNNENEYFSVVPIENLPSKRVPSGIKYKYYYTTANQLLMLEPVEIIQLDINTIDYKGNTMLMYAVKSNNMKVVRILFCYLPNLNIKNYEGETALMIAAKNDYNDIVKLLLSHGATVNTNLNQMSELEWKALMILDNT